MLSILFLISSAFAQTTSCPALPAMFNSVFKQNVNSVYFPRTADDATPLFQLRYFYGYWIAPTKITLFVEYALEAVDENDPDFKGKTLFFGDQKYDLKRSDRLEFELPRTADTYCSLDSTHSIAIVDSSGTEVAAIPYLVPAVGKR